ncbi:MAG: hypothetical protein HFE41_01880 [Clostridia bacterium]|jgi:hypothetical protein|nr:hypothetical protein [Clostridia bacterium]
MAKKKRNDDLDTTTSFADMNVDGFRWYDPHMKRNGGRKREKNKVTRKEYWAMVKGAFLAVGPYILGAIAIFGLMILLAYLWLS